MQSYHTLSQIAPNKHWRPGEPYPQHRQPNALQALRRHAEVAAVFLQEQAAAEKLDRRRAA